MGVFGKLFGNKQKVETIDDPAYIETIIKAGKDKPLGVSGSNVMYAGYNELGGYYYLQTAVIGRLKVKTKTGAKLFVDCKGTSLELEADMNELESNVANPLEGYVTTIDFQIEKTDVERLKRSNIKGLRLVVKNNDIEFDVYSKG